MTPPLRISNFGPENVPVMNRWADQVTNTHNSLHKAIEATNQKVQTVQVAVSNTGIPKDVGSASVTQTGYIGDGVLYSEVTTTYSSPNPLGTFAGIFLVIKGYRGSSELVKVSEHTFVGVAGGSASFKTILQRTHETVTLYFVAKNSDEAARSDWQNAPSTTVVLDGGSIAAVGAPCPVSAPTTVTNALTTGGALTQYVSGQAVSFPGTIAFDVQSTGGVVDVLLWASNGANGPNGYFLRFDGRISNNAGALLIVNNGTWSSIGTAKATANAAALSGWHHVEARISTDRVFDLFVDGVWQATAADTTYAPTGATYYGYEIVASPIIATPDFVNRTTDHVPDGSYSMRTYQYVGGVVVIDNADFEASTSLINGAPPGWAVDSANTTASYETSTQQSGLQSLKCVFAGSFGNVFTLKKFKVLPGELYRISGYMKTLSGVNGQIQCWYADLNGNFLNQSIATTTNAAWTFVSGTGTVPTNAVYMVIRLGTAGGVTGTVWYDNIHVIRAATAFEVTPINTSGHATVTGGALSQSGATTLINVASRTLQFGDGTVTYNAGSRDPGSLGTWYIYTDDPGYAGGAVTYQSSALQSDVYAANGRIFFGVITTVSGGGATSTSAPGSGGGKINLT